MIGQAQGFVHGDFSPDGYGQHPRPRNPHVVRVFDHDGNFAVTVAHLHGLRDPAGKHDTPARRAQADALIRTIRTVARPGERLVVCGDFNVRPDSETLEMLRTLGLTELVTSRGHAGTRTSFYNKPAGFADYLLVGPEVAVVAFDVVAAPRCRITAPCC